MNCMLYVVGSWNMLMLIVRWGQTFYDGTLNEFLFRHGTKSTIVVYMVHWLFIEIIQAHVVRPYGISLVPALAMTFPLTLMCCWAVYASALCVPFMGIVFGMGPSSTSSDARPAHEPLTDVAQEDSFSDTDVLECDPLIMSDPEAVPEVGASAA